MEQSTESYLEVLEMLGLEEVMRVRPNIVVPLYVGEFWVRGTIGFG